MALLQEVTTQQGIKANYWKLGMVSIDTNLKEFNFSLNLYVSKDAAKKENAFIETRCYSSVSCDHKNDMELVNKNSSLYERYIEKSDVNIIKALYECAKELDPSFEDEENN